jgi:hypothetical protein
MLSRSDVDGVRVTGICHRSDVEGVHVTGICHRSEAIDVQNAVGVHGPALCIGLIRLMFTMMSCHGPCTGNASV